MPSFSVQTRVQTITNGGFTLTIERSNEGIAPEIVAAYITPTSAWPARDSYGGWDERLAECDVFWSFGDDGATHTNAYIPTQQRDANNENGNATLHLYQSAGTYTIRADVYDRSAGKWYYQEQSITVADPETEYAGTATIFLDSTATYANKPTGAQEASTWQAAVDLARGAGAPRRIMFENGQTWNDPPLEMRHADLPSLDICARDPNGAATTLDFSSSYGVNFPDFFNLQAIDFSGVKDFKVRDLNVTGAFDATSATAASPTDHMVRLVVPGDNAPDYVMLDNLTTSGIHDTLTTAASTARALLVSRCNITNWSNFGLYFSGATVSGILDCTIIQAAGANANGRGQKQLGFADHGPVRHAGGFLCVVVATAFGSENGWTANVNHATAQACLRWNTNGGADRRLTVRKCMFMNGERGITASPANYLLTACIAQIDIGECGFIHGHTMVFPVVLNHTGGVVENCYRVTPTSPALADSANHCASTFCALRSRETTVKPFPLQTDWASVPNYVRNCFSYLARPYGTTGDNYGRGVMQNFSGNTWSEDGGSITDTNCRIYIIPSDITGGPDTAAGPLTLTTFADAGLTQPNSASFFDWNDPTPDSTVIVPATTPLWIDAASGSDMVADATEGTAADLPLIDYYGRRRWRTGAAGYTPSRGPFELDP